MQDKNVEDKMVFGWKVLFDLGLVIKDGELIRYDPKFIDLFFKEYNRSLNDLKGKENLDAYCQRISQGMVSEIFSWWIDKQSEKEKEKWSIYKEKSEEMNILYNFILAINLTNMDGILKNKKLSDFTIQKE